MAVEAEPEPRAAPVTPSDESGDPNPSPERTDDERAEAALRHEAAGYRRQLRTAEAERNRLREQLHARDRADAERLAGQTMANGADLFAAGVELGALRDEDGALSPELVEQAVAGVLEQRPHWRRARTVSFDGGARMPAPEPGPSFGEALKGAGRPITRGH